MAGILSSCSRSISTCTATAGSSPLLESSNQVHVCNVSTCSVVVVVVVVCVCVCVCVRV